MDRELTDIARRGLDAAGALVERFSDALDSTAGSSGGVDAVGQAWAEVIRTTATAWSGNGSSHPADPGRVEVGVAGGIVVSVEVSAAAGVGRGELWVHNPTTEPVAELRFVPGPLRGAGGPVAGAVIALDPVGVAPLAARSSHGVDVEVSVSEPTAGDRLRSLVLVDGLPDVWAVIDVTVT